MWNRVLVLTLVIFSALEVKSRAKPSKGKGKGKPSSPRPSPKPSPAATTSSQIVSTASSPAAISSLFLIVGGEGGDIHDRDIELYHPTIANHNCSLTPLPLNSSLGYHSTVYHDNTIYICPAYRAHSFCISHSSGMQGWKWHTLSPWPLWYYWDETLVLNNTLFFLGGVNRTIFVDAASTPLPLPNHPVLTPVPNLSYKGMLACSVTINPLSLVITGGASRYGALSSVLQYNIETRTETSLPSLMEKRMQHGCIVVERDTKKWLIVTGGYNYKSTGFMQRIDSTEMLELGGSSWVALGNLNGARTGHSMVISEVGVLVLGGIALRGNRLDTVEMLDWETKKWKVMKPSLNKERYVGDAVEIPAKMFHCADISSSASTTTTITTTTTTITTTTTTTTITMTTTTIMTTTTVSSSSSTTVLRESSTSPKPGHCEDGNPDPVDIKENWTTGCYDVDGNSYIKGEFLESCCGCFKFNCFVIQYNTTLIPPNYFWEKVREDSCCSDCDGTVYPAGSVMQSRDFDDSCKTTITTQCIYISKQQKAVVQETSKFQQCCSNSSGVYPTGTSMLYPETCSIQECLRPSGRQEASWISSQELEGCNCCVYKGKLVQNGGWVILANGDNSTCCEGRLLTAVENSSPTSSSTSNSTTTTPTATITTTTPEFVTFPDDKCFFEDTNITFHDLGKNRYGQDEKPEWIIDQGGRRLMEMLNTRPSVGLSNLGDPTRPVSFSGRVYSNASDYDVIGMVFGYQNETNFFVVASASILAAPGRNWYVGRLHATCGDSCQTSKTISNAIWFPHEHPEDMTVLYTGSNFWTIPNKYKFSICFDPSRLLLNVNVSRVVEDGEDVFELKSGTIPARTYDPAVDAMSHLGGFIGVYVDSQMLTTWDQLDCTDCHLDEEILIET